MREAKGPPSHWSALPPAALRPAQSKAGAQRGASTAVGERAEWLGGKRKAPVSLGVSSFEHPRLLGVESVFF